MKSVMRLNVSKEATRVEKEVHESCTDEGRPEMDLGITALTVVNRSLTNSDTGHDDVNDLRPMKDH